MRFRQRLIARCAAATLLWSSAWVLGACGRTGLSAEGDLVDDPIDIVELPEASIEAAVDAGPDAAIERAVETPPPVVGPTTGACQPAPESTPIPCPGGGSRYCVAGRWSACPERCDVCVPGSQRVCFISYCLYWGVQTCAADGKGFGSCREQRPPAECDDVARSHHNSRELEQCCLDNGYCCVDEHDIDNDGNRSEFLGRCDEVLCHP